MTKEHMTDCYCMWTLNVKKGNMTDCYFMWTLNLGRDKWAHVTAAWRILRLRLEERRPMWRIAANILNKQSRTVDKVWSSSLGVGRSANNSSP